MIPKLELTLQNTIAGAGVFTLGLLAGRYWSSAAGTTISGKISDDIGSDSVCFDFHSTNVVQLIDWKYVVYDCLTTIDNSLSLDAN